MRICIVGCGYVGLITAVGLAKLGYNVSCVEVNKEIVRKVNKGIAPFFEPGLERLLKSGIRSNKLYATCSLQTPAVSSDIIFICVGTPPKKDGTVNLEYVWGVGKEIKKALKNSNKYRLVVMKSTVPPGTSELLISNIKKTYSNCGICANPEFLREGSAIQDFFKPDRIIIGVEDKKDAQILKMIYAPLKTRVFITNIKTAEMIKYASNAFLATKVSFINEIGNICKKLGINVYEVASGMGLDRRISPHFLNAGCGFGGSCLPKDLLGLIRFAEKQGYTPELLKSVEKVNKNQPLKLMEIMEKKVNLKGKRVAILGLAFKSNTDDIRESPSIPLIKALLKKHAKVIAYDKLGAENMKKIYPEIYYAQSVKDAVKRSDIIVITNEAKEFADMSLYKNKLVFEGRRILKRKRKNVEGICW